MSTPRSAYVISQVEVLDPEAWERHRAIAAPDEYAPAPAIRGAAVRRRLLFAEGVDTTLDP